MATSFYNKYRVDNVPFYLLPFYLIYGYGVGAIMNVYMLLVLHTSKIIYTNAELLNPHQNYVYTFWHRDVVAFFLSKPRPLNFAAINHPFWYMKIVHVAMKSIGVKEICLGSSGNNGIEAASDLVKLLKNGRSTFINPDGPTGPAFAMKKGVLFIAKNSEVPVVVVNYEYSNCKQLKGWDKKRIPLPFTTIKVNYSNPIIVTESNFQKATVELETLLKAS
jgi:lysophospholipid acyltransferase (LPLAT)-like uncharacterized protein